MMDSLPDAITHTASLHIILNQASPSTVMSTILAKGDCGTNKEPSSRNTVEVDFSNLLPKEQIRATLKQWIHDDIPSFDVGGLVVGNQPRQATLYMKSPGVFAGKPFFTSVFEDVLKCTIEWNDDVAVEGRFFGLPDATEDDGSSGISSSNATSPTSFPKIALAVVTGPVHRLLQGERTALNTISRCSGVATAAFHAVSTARSLGWNGHVAGTRKTTPGFRVVEKYGLLVGGAATHRLDLSQMVMLKDNHIWSCDGSIHAAVQRAKAAAGFSQKIEVECQSLEEAIAAATAGADIVMLDNFEPEKLKMDARTLKESFPHVLIEASGGITVDSMGAYLSEHVDIISQGSLTQGYACLDYSLKINH